MRFSLALLLLFGSMIGLCDAIAQCEMEKSLYKLKNEPCEATIQWKVHDEKQATSVCFEYFPTTFVKGVKLDEWKIKCTVEPAYQCVAGQGVNVNDLYLIYDKCYYFPKQNNLPIKGTIDQYKVLKDASDPKKGREMCKGGKLSIFYSYAHAKFVGLRAKALGIDKLWIGITKDGKSIEEPDKMMHTNLWKLIEGDYLDGNEIKTFSNGNVPDEAKYFFLRTRTDHFHNRFQGSFERASGTVKATFACEFDAKFTEHQDWYCDKMKEIGFDTVFDKHVDEGKLTRCLYVTANKYTFKGTFDDMKNMKGCEEVPSLLHSAGIDDGTADESVYKSFTKHADVPLRIAAYYHGILTDQTVYWENTFVLKKGGAQPSYEQRKELFEQWRHIGRNGEIKSAVAASFVQWAAGYPKNENSDFPGESTTMGIKNGEKIDMPPAVRAPVICSLIFFQECENKKPCSAQFECRNKKQYMTSNADPNLHGFFTCECPGPTAPSTDGIPPYVQPHILENGICKWNGGNDKCAWMLFDGGKTAYKDKSNENLHDKIYNGYNDKLTQIVVKQGCHMTVRSHGLNWRGGAQFELLKNVGYGTHIVPHHSTGTLPKSGSNSFSVMAASSAECWCN